MAGLSPMMQQYMQIKEQNKDSIVFFRLGDFYEMFFDDAKMVSEELELTLTGRDCGLEERAPMCGVPYHSCEGYIARLVSNGHRVAICEQMEDPETAKGIVKRDVVRVVTPGTVIEDCMLEEGRNNYLCSVSLDADGCGICFCDASTGSAQITEISGENFFSKLLDELGRFQPKELICCNDNEALKTFASERLECRLTPVPSEAFDTAVTSEKVAEHFGVSGVTALGIEQSGRMASALGAVLFYLNQNGMAAGSVVKKVDLYAVGQYMKLDLSAIRNLELCETMRSKSKRGSLLWVLDKTKTAMGKRLIKNYIQQPLTSVTEISLRQNAVDELASDAMLSGEIAEYLSSIRDIERLMSRIVYGTGGAKELRSIADTAAFFPLLKGALGSVQSGLLRLTAEQIDNLDDIKELIDAAIQDNPPVSVREGEIIRDGYSAEVDSLRYDIKNGAGLLAEIETKERERTGIKNLKVGFNRVFGYYIEVTNSFKDKVPADYIRKQTLTGCERYINEELKSIEARVLGAKDRIVKLEYEIFCDVRNKVSAELNRFQKTAAAIARLDVLRSFAHVAVENAYCRPLVNNSARISIKNGRHPVVELISKTPFVCNDTNLDMNEERCQIITGPNMAGKSTYMRQVAIITLMAQIGSFVPAESATIGVADAIFTRVGASDDLASGQSTFMVEMNEVSNILKNATSNSLLILDEIGRGTSTFDGMSIAKAVLEHAADKKKLGARTLFATHYHELTSMENEIPGVKNYNIAVKLRGDDIIFLRRIVRGGADRSYGIEVAKLSGIPESVIRRAKQVMKELENEGVQQTRFVNSGNTAQIALEAQNAQQILDELKVVDVNTLTPIEAMGLLSDLTEKARGI